VAKESANGYALKCMLNHTVNGDVTGAHYVGKSESQLRNAWQTVADFIEQLAKKDSCTSKNQSIGAQET
jgi:hypothetical protein